MTPRRFSTRRPGVGVLAFALPLLLAGCTFPRVFVEVEPDRVSMQAGNNVTIAASARVVFQCDKDDPLCTDLPADAVFDFHVHGLPTGVSALVDTGLQSPSTPGAALIMLAADHTAEAGRYDASIIASFEGQTLGKTDLDLQILPSLSSAMAPPAAIAAGTRHSMVVLQDGTLLTWGDNFSGQLGIGDTRDRALPTRVDLPVGVIAVSGSKHTLAVGVDGSVWAWGNNRTGELGLGVDTDRLSDHRQSPVRVAGLPEIDQVAAGYTFSLALARDGTVWSWGSNKSGQLGDPSRPNTDHVPSPIPGLEAIQAIAAGLDHALALDDDGRIWTWGDNGEGELGDPSRDGPQSRGTPALLPDLSGVQEVVSGTDFSLARTSDGSVWYWGYGLDRGLQEQAIPIPVTGLSDPLALAAGVAHALALGADGTAWAWGSDGSGQLGDGDERQDQDTPVAVMHLTDVASVAAGGTHSLALLHCGQVWSWGSTISLQDDGYFSPIPLLVGGTGDDSGCDHVALRVIEVGDGAGWATSPAAGSDCNTPGSSSDLACAEWEAILPGGTQASLSALPAAGSVFGGWGLDCQGGASDLQLTLDQSMTCTARFDDDSTPAVLLTVNPTVGHVTSTDSNVSFPEGPDRIDCGEDCGALFRVGTVITLMAADAPGHELESWQHDCTGTDPSTQITIGERSHCEARYRPFRLTVETGSLGQVTSDPPGILCDAGLCSFGPGVGQVTLTAVPNLGYEVDAWGGDCSGTGPQSVVTMDADKSCTVAFRRIPGFRFLSVVVVGGGTVTSDPAGIDCEPACLGLFADGTQVDLSVTPAAGYEFHAWSEDCSGLDPQTTVTTDADKICKATFLSQAQEPVAEFFSYVNIEDPFLAPAVGRVVTFDGSASHMLDPATGEEDPGGINRFLWDIENDGTIEAQGSRSTASLIQHAFQISGDHPVRLKVIGGPFDLEDEKLRTLAVAGAQEPLLELSVVKAGTGLGTITTSPPGLLSCRDTCAGTGPLLLQEGTQVNLVADASPGSHFAGWSGVGCTGATSSIIVEMTAARDCTATFELDQHLLTVNNNGGGDVSSDPAGIDCGEDCSEAYAHADLVTLTATPHAGFDFDGWSGCDQVNGDQCEVTLTDDRTITASFSEQPPAFVTLTVIKDGTGGGTVVSLTSDQIDCGADCMGTFTAGEVVGLLATPDAGSSFIRWTGCDDADGEICAVTMTTDRTVRATFD